MLAKVKVTVSQGRGKVKVAEGAMEEVDDGMGMEDKGGQDQDPGTCVDTDLQLQDEDQRLLAMLEEANR